MIIKPLKNLTKDDFYFGLNTDDLIGTIFSIFVLRHFVLSSDYTIVLLVLAGSALIFVSYLRLNYRRKTIRDFFRFSLIYAINSKVKV